MRITYNIGFMDGYLDIGVKYTIVVHYMNDEGMTEFHKDSYDKFILNDTDLTVFSGNNVTVIPMCNVSKLYMYD